MRSGVSVAVVRGINVVLGFSVLLVLTRIISTPELGMYAYATAILSILAIPVAYGWRLSYFGNRPAHCMTPTGHP